jgi:AbrB family looped-hinge helix DNA binding protein
VSCAIWNPTPKIDIAGGKTHLTGMNAHTKMSQKGQVVIPKDVRDRLRLAPGDRLDVVERPDGVLLRKHVEKGGETFDEITARLRSRISYNGPAISIEDMGTAIKEMWEAGGPRWDG